MELAQEVFERFEAISWLSNSGLETVDFRPPFGVSRIYDSASAKASCKSNEWADVRTEEQGNLTGFLAKFHYQHYGGHWNRLVRAARLRIDEKTPEIREALSRFEMADLAGEVALDLTRAALQYSYARRFAGTPNFFERLLVIYEAGLLPCGFTQTRDGSGHFLVF